MVHVLKQLLCYFKFEKTVYSHRSRTIEIIAKEKGIDIELIGAEVRDVMKDKGRAEAISQLRRRFHVPLATAWVFVDKLK